MYLKHENESNNFNFPAICQLKHALIDGSRGLNFATCAQAYYRSALECLWSDAEHPFRLI